MNWGFHTCNLCDLWESNPHSTLPKYLLVPIVEPNKMAAPFPWKLLTATLLPSSSSLISCYRYSRTNFSSLISNPKTSTNLLPKQVFRCSNYSFSTSNHVVDSGNENTKKYLELTDEELLKQCEMDTFKASGPGGQHRNKRESAVRLKHLPTAVIAQVIKTYFANSNSVSLRLITKQDNELGITCLMFCLCICM